MDSAELQRGSLNSAGTSGGKALFEAVLNAVDQPWFIVDPDSYRVVWVNSRAQRLISGDELHCYALIHHLDRPCSEQGLRCPLEQVKKTGESTTSENVCFDERGETQYIEVHAYPIFDDRGQIAHVVVAIADPSRRLAAETALGESQQLLNDVETVAKIGGWEMDLVTRKATWTRGTYDIVEIDPGEPAPGPEEHLDYYLPEFRPMVAEAMRALIEEDKPLDFESPFRTAKGNLKWCRVLGRAVRRDGQCIGVHGTFQDITDYREIIQKLEEHQKLLEERVQERTCELDERLKELNCLYKIGDLAEEPGILLEQFIQLTLDLIPAAFQYPETTCARIQLEDQEYRTGDFRETSWKLVSDITVFGTNEGFLEVFFLRPRSGPGAVPFLGEEKEFLRAVTERLGRIIERRRTEAVMDLARFPSENPNPVLRISLDGEVLYSNEAGRKLLTEWQCDIGRVVPERWRMIIAQVYEAGQGRAEEAAVGDRVFLMAVAPIVEAGYVNLYGSDITARRQSELKLRQSEERFKLMMQQSPSVIELYDLNGLQVDVNEAYEELWGFPASHTVGKFNLFASEEVKRRGLLAYTQRAYEGQTVSVPEYEYDPRGDTEAQGKGRVRWLSTHIYPLKNSAGIVTNIVITHEDVTERRWAEEERELTISLLSLLNTNNDMHELMRLVLVFLKRRSQCEAVGIRLQEESDYPYFVTQGFSEEFVLKESCLCSVDEAGQPVCAADGSVYLECMCGNIIKGRFDPSKPYFTAHGSFWTNSTTELLAGTTDADRGARTRNYCNTAGYESVALVPLRVAGETFGLLQFNDKKRGCFTVEKIALYERLADNLAIGLAQRRAEAAALIAREELIARQWAEKESVQAELDRVQAELIRKTQLAAIGQVSGSIAHDLRNPLASVRNANYLLKRRLPQDEPRLTDQLRIIDEEVSRADQIITNLLSLAQKRTCEKQRVDLDRLIQGVLDRTDIPGGITYTSMLRSIPFIVLADPDQLAQVVSNILDNAIAAMEQKGVFLVEAMHDPNQDVIEFKDTGSGIPVEVCDKLLEPLVTTKTRGTGLGLTICRQIIESHGGQIEAHNRPEGGAVIRICLPQTECR